jgi:hypothetical protein
MMVVSSSPNNPVSEKAVKAALKTYLKSIGAYWYMPINLGYGPATIDFFVCYKGKFYGIETKRTAKSEPTLRQQVVLDEIAHAGGGVWLENSTGLETTRERLG